MIKVYISAVIFFFFLEFFACWEWVWGKVEIPMTRQFCISKEKNQSTEISNKNEKKFFAKILFLFLCNYASDEKKGAKNNFGKCLIRKKWLPESKCDKGLIIFFKAILSFFCKNDRMTVIERKIFSKECVAFA